MPLGVLISYSDHMPSRLSQSFLPLSLKMNESKDTVRPVRVTSLPSSNSQEIKGRK